MLAKGDEGNTIFRFYPKNKGMEKISEYISNPYFSGNSLYYIEYGEVGINKVDLKTRKGKIVRGQAWKNKLQYEDNIVRYKGIVGKQGEVFYICRGEDGKVRLYQYRDHKKDKIQHGFFDNSYEFVVDDLLFCAYLDEKDDFYHMLKIHKLSEN